jgi:hypothetical protein
MYMDIYIYPKNIWGIGNDADNYIDGSNNLSAKETRAPQVGAKDTIYRSYNLASEHFLLL